MALEIKTIITELKKLEVTSCFSEMFTLKKHYETQKYFLRYIININNYFSFYVKY